MLRSETRPLAAAALALGGLLGSCDREPVHVSEAAAPRSSIRPAEDAPVPVEEPWRRELAGGLVVELIEPGPGRRAARIGDVLTLHYSLRVAGEEEALESTAKSGIPFRFRLGEGEVVQAWERGLVGLRGGSRLRIEAPAALCYGDSAHGRVPPNSDLVFEIDLVRVER